MNWRRRREEEKEMNKQHCALCFMVRNLVHNTILFNHNNNIAKKYQPFDRVVESYLHDLCRSADKWAGGVDTRRRMTVHSSREKKRARKFCVLARREPPNHEINTVRIDCGDETPRRHPSWCIARSNAMRLIEIHQIANQQAHVVSL